MLRRIHAYGSEIKYFIAKSAWRPRRALSRHRNDKRHNRLRERGIGGGGSRTQPSACMYAHKMAKALVTVFSQNQLGGAVAARVGELVLSIKQGGVSHHGIVIVNRIKIAACRYAFSLLMAARRNGIIFRALFAEMLNQLNGAHLGVKFHRRRKYFLRSRLNRSAPVSGRRLAARGQVVSRNICTAKSFDSTENRRRLKPA